MGRKKQKVRWTSVEEGFFTNENEDLEQQGSNKEGSPTNHSTGDATLGNHTHHPKRFNRRSNKKPKFHMSQVSQEKPRESITRNSVTGCGSTDCTSCTCDMYCCCTTHEHTSACEEMPKYKKTSKMDKNNSESNNTSNAVDHNEAANAKDCDTNSEHSSIMNDSIHSSQNNRTHRMESFSSSGTGSRDYERHSNHGDRRYDRKYHYNREGSRRGYAGSERSGGSTWVNAPLAPRFERKAAIHAANAAANGANYNPYPYGDQNGANNGYDDSCSMSMDMEDLPNGFTKIRSKNLDVLFKKDYYAQRVHLNSGSSGTGNAAQLHSNSVSPNPQVISHSQSTSSVAENGVSDPKSIEIDADNKEEGSARAESITSEISKQGADSSVEKHNAYNHEDGNLSNVSEPVQNEISSSQNCSDDAVLPENKISPQFSDCNDINEIDSQETSIKTNKNSSLIQTEEHIVKSEDKKSKQIDNSDKTCTLRHNTTICIDSSTQNSTPINEVFNEKNRNRDTNVIPFDPSSQDTACKSVSNDRFVSSANAGKNVGGLPRPSNQKINSNQFEGSATKFPQGNMDGDRKRPSLFLYSPSSNTIIPCEEIIIPNHPNVMQQSLKVNEKEGHCSEQGHNETTSDKSKHILNLNPADSTNIDINSNKENNPNLLANNNGVLTGMPRFDTTNCRTEFTQEISQTNNLDTSNKNNGIVSPATPGMNENAPAFIPRAQQHYYQAALNIQHLPQPHPIIHYDQFGAPYTSYGTAAQLSAQATMPSGPSAPVHTVPSLQNPVLNREFMPTSIQYHQQSSVMSNVTVSSCNEMASGTSPTTPNGAISSETSSTESSVPMHSPADLSVYSPANWVPSPTQTSHVPVSGEPPRSGNMINHPQMPLQGVDGSEVISGVSRPALLQNVEFQRSISSPASYGNAAPNVPNVNGHIPYGTESNIGFQQRPQYPPQYNSHVYYQPAAASAHYVSNQGGSNVWYNLPQQQFYSLNGTQAFVGPQYQGYANGYTSSSGCTNLQFMCESSTMPSSAGDSMAEDDPRDRSEEEADLQNKSRTNKQTRTPQAQLKVKNDPKKATTTTTMKEQDRIKSLHHAYSRHPISNSATVMVSTNLLPTNFPSKKEKDTLDGSNKREEGIHPFIPGLPAERLTTKRVHKKRRKKKNMSNEFSSGEPVNLSTQSTAIKDGHPGIQSSMTQQHPKSKAINNIHRGSSSSEDLFSESNILRADNANTKLSSTNSSTKEKDSNTVKTTKISNQLEMESSSAFEVKGCDEQNEIDSHSNKFPKEQNMNPVFINSAISKSSGCDNGKKDYPIRKSLPEECVEGPMQSLPTTSPSSPLQSINPSSSSILASSSLSSQEEDNENISGKEKNPRIVINENKLNGTYEACLSKINRCRDRSSSISSNEEVNDYCTEKTFDAGNTSSETLKYSKPAETFFCEKNEMQSLNKTQNKNHSNNYNNVQVIDVTNTQKSNSDQPSGPKYADTLKNPNNIPHEEIEKSTHQTTDTRTLTGDIKSKPYNYGSQSRQKNKRINNNSKSMAPMETSNSYSNLRGSQATQGSYRAQRTYSSQNSQSQRTGEELSSNGKKLYSKVACKTSDTVQSVNLPSSKQHELPTKDRNNLKQDINSSKQLKDKKDKPLPSELNWDQESRVTKKDGESQRRNSADDAGWEMATGTHGGSKTKRNRKGTRAVANNIQVTERISDSTESINDKIAQVKYSEKSHSISPARAISRLPEGEKQHDECKTTLGDGKEDKVELTTEEIKNNISKSSEGANINIAPEGEEISTIESESNSIEDKAASAPASKSSTLRRQRKKRTSHDQSNNIANSTSNPSNTSTIRPVLIQDGLLDIFGKGPSNFMSKGMDAKITSNITSSERTSDILDHSTIEEAVQKGPLDTLFVSEIGYGMIGGPISMGRFGTSKYTPPDRSEEIRPMQELLKEKQKAEEDADAASKGTVIKVLMGEVQVSTAVELADSAEQSEDSFKGSNHRFQDVTDASHETQEVENKLDAMKTYSVSSTKPADLDLD